MGLVYRGMVGRFVGLAHREVRLRMRKSPHSPHCCTGSVVLAGGLACFFVYLELLKAHRASQWSGIVSGDWLRIGLAVVAYGLVLYILLRGAAGLFRRLLGKWPHAAGGLAVVASGAAVWFALSMHREQTPTLDDGIVLASLLAFGGARALGGWRWGWTDRAVGGALMVCWLAGIVALIGAGEFFLFSPGRASAVTLYPVVWLGVVVVVAGALLIRRASLAWWTLAAAVGLALPPVLVVALLYAPSPPSGDRPPNLVFLVSDTLRADYCSVYGGAVPTPNLERLAARGTVFEQSYALAPWTLPSMTGLVSSQYPPSLTPGAGHEVWSLEMNMYAVDDGAPTLAERLAEVGYTTGAVTANAFLPSIPGMMSGFQVQASSHPILLRDEGYFRQLPFLGALVAAWCPPLADIRSHNTTIALDHYARAFIRRHRDQPFLLWVHYIDPHAPYDPPESLRRVSEGPWPFFHPYSGGEAWGLPILGKNFFVEEDHRDYVQSLYEGEVAYIDRFAGRLMESLATAGVGENTYLCFTSDHGEELWDHGQWGHGHSLYEEQVRVPLIFAGPGIQPQSVAEAVSAIDLVPTLAELLGVPPSPTWRGESLAPVLRGTVDGPVAKPVFFQGTTNKTETPLYGVIAGGFKLIEEVGSGRAVLYNLLSDPGEHHNIAADQPGKVAELRALLVAWQASFGAFFEHAGDGAPVLTPEMERRLGGMGYL